MKNNFNNIVILIPALNPNRNIINVVKDLNENGLFNIIVVNDGSNEENEQYFEILKNEFNIKVYKHEKNLGKGQALKTGIKTLLNENIDGVITVDADGQHLGKDVKKVAEKLGSEKIVFGERSFKKTKNVPFASKIGNCFSSLYLKLLTGIYLEDTQTGLRGIPKKYFELALKIDGDRFDYEMNFLKFICQKKMKIDTVEIETVYENRIRNFKIIRDSVIVYKDFFKNIISSTICAIVDILLFYVFIMSMDSIFWANVIARIISGIIDFIINKIWVYNSSNNVSKEAYKYFLLFVGQMFLNSALVTILGIMFEKIIIIIKIIVNIILYLTNFFIKSRYIFKN